MLYLKTFATVHLSLVVRFNKHTLACRPYGICKLYSSEALVYLAVYAFKIIFISSSVRS